MLSPEYFLHASNIARLVSFSVKDVLWLRVFAIVASLIGVPYFYLRDAVLWEPILWSAGFTAVNGYHVWRLWLERRPVELTADEAMIYNLTFFPLNPRQFLELVRLGTWADLEAGHVLIRPGELIDELWVPLSDGIEGRVGDHTLGRFAGGAIIGASALFDTRVRQLEAIAAESCRVLQLPVLAIQQRAKHDQQLTRTLERIAREDLGRKLDQLVTFATQELVPANVGKR